MSLTLEQIDAERAAIKERQAIAAAQIEELKQTHPLAFFEPNPFQYRALTNLIKGLKRNPDGITFAPVRNIVANTPGNGAGKTFGTIALIGNICTGVMSPWYDYDLFKLWPFPKEIRLIADKKLFEDDGEVRKAILKWWPRAYYTESKGDYSYYSSYQWQTGFMVKCMTFDQSDRAHEGGEQGMVIFLEPPKDNRLWNSYARAFRHGGIQMLDATMIYGSEWIDREIINADGTIFTDGTPEDNCEDTVIQTPMGECRGKLARATIDGWAEDYKKQGDGIYEARFLGMPLHRRGRALAGLFDRAIHVVPSHPGEFPIRMFKVNVDPHPGKPWWISVVGIDSHGDSWVMDEWPRYETFGRFYSEVPYDPPTRGEDFYFALVAELLGRYKPNIPMLDFKMGNSPTRDASGVSTLRGRMENYLRREFTAQSVDVMSDGGGLAALKSALSYNREQPVSFTNHPKLRILAHCSNTIHQLENLSFKKSDTLAGYGTSEQLADDHLDAPRAIMGILTNSDGPGRIIIPGSHNSDYSDKRRRFAAAMKLEEQPIRRGLAIHA